MSFCSLTSIYSNRNFCWPHVNRSVIELIFLFIKINRDEQIDQNEFELDIVTDRPFVLSSTIRAPIRPAFIEIPEALTHKNQFTEPKVTTAAAPSTARANSELDINYVTPYNDTEYETTTTVAYSSASLSSTSSSTTPHSTSSEVAER